MTQQITLWQPPQFYTRWLHRFTNAELTGNTYLSGTLGRKPQNMLASLWSDWFSTLVFAGRLCFDDALNQLRLEGTRVGRRMSPDFLRLSTTTSTFWAGINSRCRKR